MRVIFFDGTKEVIVNNNGNLGKYGEVFFEVDEWGTKHYYVEAGTDQYSGTGIDMRRSIKKYFANIGSINLADQGMGQYYRIEQTYAGKLQVWANRYYPAWALKD